MGLSELLAADRRVSFGGGDLPEGDAAGVLDLRPGGGAAEEADHVDGDPAGQKDPVIEDGFPELSEGPFLQKEPLVSPEPGTESASKVRSERETGQGKGASAPG